MKPITRFNHWLPPLLGADAITLWPFVLFSRGEHASTIDGTIEHELVHVRQIEQLGWFRFYFRYALEYVRLRFLGNGHADAYFAISYEKQAYERQRQWLEEKSKETPS